MPFRPTSTSLHQPAVPVPAPTAGMVTKADKAFNLSQGTNFLFKIVGDAAKSNQIALNNAASGKFADEPLGLYDPASPLSAPIEALLPRPLADYRDPVIARQADADSNEWGLVNTATKSAGYVAGILGNVVTYSQILGIGDPKHRALMFYKNTGSLVQNLSWLGEKILVVPMAAAVAAGDYRAALLYRLGGHFLSNSGWAAGFFGGINMIRDEAHLYMKAQDSRDTAGTYEINQANVQNAAGNLAFALPRIGTQSIALFSGAATYLGAETVTENAYRIANGAYDVPWPLVGAFVLFSVIPPLLSLRVSSWQMKARAVSTFTDRVQDAFSIAGNLGLLAGAIAVCYVPADPHSMMFSVAGNSFLVGQYLIKERATLKNLPSALWLGARLFAVGCMNACLHPMDFTRQRLKRLRDIGRGIAAMTRLTLEMTGLQAQDGIAAEAKTTWREEWRGIRRFLSAIKAESVKKR